MAHRSQIGRLPGVFGFIFLASAYFCACSPATDSTGQAPAKLQTTVLEAGDSKIKAEIADTPETMGRGLMFRDNLGENEGMLFVFPAPRQATFWMRNTKIPLSVAYLDADGRILEIHAMFPYDESTVESKTSLVSYALEMNQGWFDRHHAGVGETVRGLPKR